MHQLGSLPENEHFLIRKLQHIEHKLRLRTHQRHCGYSDCSPNRDNLLYGLRSEQVHTAMRTPKYKSDRGGGKVRGARREVRGGKMRGTGARYQCETLGNLRGWNVRGAAANWRKRRRCRM